MTYEVKSYYCRTDRKGNQTYVDNDLFADGICVIARRHIGDDLDPVFAGEERDFPFADRFPLQDVLPEMLVKAKTLARAEAAIFACELALKYECNSEFV